MFVEEFGVVFLCGMGWDGKERVLVRKLVVWRLNWLGFGVKELKDVEDFGGWD